MTPRAIASRVRFSRWLWSQGASAGDSLALVASYNSRIARRRLKWPGVWPVCPQLHLEQARWPFAFQQGSDFTVLNEVFYQQQYKLPQPLTPRVVLDLGANAGLSSLFFRTRYPAARVIAVEAFAPTYERLAENAARWGNVQPVHAAVSDMPGHRAFYATADRSLSSSLFQRPATHTAHGLAEEAHTVPTESLEGLLDQYGPSADVVKFDIEGAEWQVFQSFRQWERLGVLIGEVHPDLFGKSLEQFFGLFPRHTPHVVLREGVRAVVRFDPRPAP